ncbi:MAG: GNAT family N-acetyltransferase [Candidatus Gracilibacteria bacterium]|nr:GNAT family N-acetyltransferase [Candidatus Gracilibacteria bacterium]
MIRSYEKKDAERCSEIMRACLDVMEEYEPDLKELLCEKRTGGWLDEQFQKYDRVWVYDREGIILGYASLNAETIEGLYVDPHYHHENIGTTLYRELEQYAQKKLEFLKVESSFFAESFYLKEGFQTIEKGQVAMGTFTVLFIDMKKDLVNSK